MFYLARMHVQENMIIAGIKSCGVLHGMPADLRIEPLKSS